MKKGNSTRLIYGIGLILVAVAFVLPIIDLGLLGELNGFEIGKILGSFKSSCQVALIAVFGFAVLGAVGSFLPKMKILDLVSFIGLIASAIFFFVSLGVKSNAKAPSWLTDFALDICGIGFYVLLGGLVVAIVGFVLSLGKKR